MATRAWYPMTYRTSPLPAAVADAHRLRLEHELAADGAVRSALFAELRACLALATAEPEAARSRWLRWARERKAAVASTLGRVPAVAIAACERHLPVRREAAGVVRRLSLTFTPSPQGDAGVDGARPFAEAPRRVADVFEVAGDARTGAATAVVALPEFELPLGIGRRGSAVPWLPLVDAGASIFAPEWPALNGAYNASCKAKLVSGTSFLAHLLADVGAVAEWLRGERGFRRVVVAAESGSCHAALLASVLVPGVDACALSRLPADSPWPLETMMILPGARLVMDAAVLAALVPPRGLLLLRPDDEADGCEWLYAARTAAALHDGSADGAAGRRVAARAAGEADALASWLEWVAEGGPATTDSPPLAPGVDFPAVVRARSASGARERFLSILGGVSDRSDLRPWSEPMEHPVLPMERVYYHSEPDVVVPGVFVAPPEGREPYPVVLALPGSSSTDVDVVLPWGLPLLQRGMAVFAVDAKASRFGHRMSENAPEAIERGTSSLAEMTWDLVRALDYLETRPDVDAGRIGCFGISIGGTQTWLLAAADVRVKAAAPVVGVASYRGIIGGIRDERIDSTFMSCLDSHTIYYYPPGLLRIGDQADFLSLIAPRPLLILAMSADNCFPLAGVVETSEALRQAYSAAGARERFDYYVGEGPHSYPVPLQERVWGWMQRWL